MITFQLHEVTALHLLTLVRYAQSDLNLKKLGYSATDSLAAAESFLTIEEKLDVVFSNLNKPNIPVRFITHEG